MSKVTELYKEYYNSHSEWEAAVGDSSMSMEEKTARYLRFCRARDAVTEDAINKKSAHHSSDRESLLQAIDTLIEERDELFDEVRDLKAEILRLQEYYEANEALEAESDEDAEAVHRAISRWVAARRAQFDAAFTPEESDGND
jgi:predicted  nucleic acid-binding Zn-ribbon protein